MAKKTAVIAFSGGLDTSFLVPFSREKYNIDHVITCTVDTGGYSTEEQERIRLRSEEVQADEHCFINAENDFYHEIIKFMIYGNVSRDGYPLCVGTERLIQAKRVLEFAKEKAASYFFHGSTGAGNDQYRFDCAAYVFGLGLIKPIAPVREHGITREFSTNYLKERGITVEEKNSLYSYNVGLWGTSIGGAETHHSSKLIPNEAWYQQPSRNGKLEIEIGFQKGELSFLRYETTELRTPLEIIKALSKLGNEFGIGRHYYAGTSIPGVKGRLAYESPAADIIYSAHTALEQITLSGTQVLGKKSIAIDFGRLVHEAKMYDPWLEDLKALLKSTQRRVTGTVFIELSPGTIGHCRTDSEFNLLAARGAQYGEASEYYDGRDAAGACRLNAFEQRLWNSM